MAWGTGSHLPDIHIPYIVETPASSKEANPRGVFSCNSSESMVPKKPIQLDTLFCGSEPWCPTESNYTLRPKNNGKNLSLTVWVAFHSSLLLSCTAEPQTGHQHSFTSPARGPCENHFPQPANCTPSNATQTQPGNVSLSLVSPLQSLAALELSREFCLNQKLFLSYRSGDAKTCTVQVRIKGHLQKNYIHS